MKTNPVSLFLNWLHWLKTRRMLSGQAKRLQRDTLIVEKPKVWSTLSKDGSLEVVYLLEIPGYVVVTKSNRRFLVKETPQEYCKLGAKI